MNPDFMELVYPNSFVSTLCSRNYKGVGRADTWGRIIVFRKTKGKKQMYIPNGNDIKTYNLYNIHDTKPVAKCFDSTLGRPYSNQGGTVILEKKQQSGLSQNISKEQSNMNVIEGSQKLYHLYAETENPKVVKCLDRQIDTPYSNQGGNVVVESKKEDDRTIYAMTYRMPCTNAQKNKVSALTTRDLNAPSCVIYKNVKIPHANQGENMAVESEHKEKLIYPSKGISTLMTENTAHAGRNMLYVSLKQNHQGENMTNGNLTNEETTTNIPSQSGTCQQTSLATSPQSEYVVRRLTPVECERLQGFPDGWTDIPWKGEAHSPDGRRYKALGNSMAVPVMRWIAERIDKVSNMKLEYQVKEFEFPTEENLF